MNSTVLLKSIADMLNQPSSLLSLQLKTETLAEHHKVEALFPVMKSGFSKAQYETLLVKMLFFYRGYEASMEEWAHLAIPRFHQRISRSLNINADLVSLAHCSREQSNITKFSFENSAEVLGAMYVMEGSTLGGLLIAKHLKKNLKLSDGQVNFYQSYGKDTGPMWVEFKNHLDSHSGESDEFKNACVTSAKDTFEKMGQIF